MPLLGTAAMLLSFDVAPEAIAEHDRWHTHEHLPERLAIPGFLRGTRWTTLRGAPRYMVLYEVQSLGTLTSGPYLERLNQPSPWTTQVMPHYRGMVRGLCSVVGSFGFGTGRICALIRFKPDPAAPVHQWLLAETLPRLPTQPGLGSAHLLQGAAPSAMTNEQHLRGKDGGMDSALIITGYDHSAVEAAAQATLADLNTRASEQATLALYEMLYSLARTEIAA
jgi:hypothetical protein